MGTITRFFRPKGPPLPPPDPLPKLPPELILYILDFLIESYETQPVNAASIAMARSLCRTSRIFSKAGHRLLYTRLSGKITNGNWGNLDTGLSGCANFLDRKPKLAALVKSVDVHCQYGDRKGAPTLCKLVRICPNLKGIALHDVIFNDAPLRHFPIDVLGAKLNSLHVGVRPIGGRFLDHFGNLHGSPLAPSNLPILRRFSVTNITHLHEWTSDILAGLEHLTIEHCSNGVIHTLVTSSATTLKSLDLVIRNWETFDILSPSAQILFNLTHFSVTLSPNPADLPTLILTTSFARYLVHTPILTDLQLQIPRADLNIIMEEKEQPGLFPLDHFCSPSVKKVELRVSPLFATGRAAKKTRFKKESGAVAQKETTRWKSVESRIEYTVFWH